jgi:hypothetical protein
MRVRRSQRPGLQREIVEFLPARGFLICSWFSSGLVVDASSVTVFVA